MKVYISQLGLGDIVFYSGHRFRVVETKDKVVLARQVKSDEFGSETESYSFSTISQLIVEAIVLEEAHQWAYFYWLGILTNQNRKKPSKAEMQKRVEETWHKFLGTFDEVIGNL